MNTKRIAAGMLAILLLFLTIAPEAAALQQAPYKGYTYNAWGESVPAQAGYLPDRIFYQEDIGIDALINASDLFAYGDRLLVVDTDNNRIVILDQDYHLDGKIESLTDEQGNISELSNPRGVYVRDDVIYIADTGNARVVVCDWEGCIQKIYEAPEGESISDDFVFAPIKIVLDSSDYLYVLSENTFEGLLTYDADGIFVGFYGSNKVQMNLSTMLTYWWKSILSKEQRESMVRFVPIEVSNVFIAPNGFIYTVTKGTDKNADKPEGKIQMLNPLGENILRYNQADTEASGGAIYSKNIYGDVENAWFKAKKIDSSIIDVHVNGDGIITALDQERGRVFQYDQESNLLFVFGGIGQQKGNFTMPAALERFQGQYVVLDSTRGSLTVFKPTYYADKVLEAVVLYNDGLYEEAEELWQEVLRINSNNTLAYKSIGKAYLQREEYKEALNYLELGQDRTAYSIAYREYRKDFVRQNLLWLLLGTVAGLAVFICIVRFLMRKLGVQRKKTHIRYR